MLERLNITVIRYVTLIIVIKTNMSWATIVITESMVTPTLPEHHLKENSNKAQGPLLLDNAITLTHSVLEVPSCYSRYSLEPANNFIKLYKSLIRPGSLSTACQNPWIIPDTAPYLRQILLNSRSRPAGQ